MTIDELKRMDYYELRAMIKDVIPRQHILKLMRKRSAVKEKGRKSNYHQYSLKNDEWMKLERLLNKEEINSFLIISNRVAACPMPLNMDVWDGLRCPFACIYCVPAGAQIMMEDGTTKNAERVREGDKIVSINLETNQPEIAIVEETMSRKANGVLSVQTESTEMRVTPEHPVFTKRGWVDAGELTEDDEVMVFFVSGPKWEKIKKIKKMPFKKPRKVYNYHVSPNNNYFANRVLVHNCYADAFKASLYSSFFDNYKEMGLRHCNPDFYKRELDKIMEVRGKDPHAIQNDVKKAIAMEIPIRLGIRFEDFIPLEKREGISLQMLDYLADLDYPVMINTKSALVGQPDYVKALARNKGGGAVHVTLISNNRGLIKGIEPGAPSYEERLKGIKALVDAGVRVVARIEPYMILINDDRLDVERYIQEVWDIGVRNITFDTYSYSAHNPGIRSNFMNYGIDFDRMFLLTCDSQAIGSLLLDKFMALFRKKGFSCSTFDYGCVPSNNQDVCCEVGDWFKGGFNYGCGVMAVRFIRRHGGKPVTWGMFEDFVNEQGGFLSESIKKEVHGLWNLTGNTSFHINWGRGIEPVGHDENGIVWRFDRKSDFRRGIVSNVTPDNRLWLYHPESDSIMRGIRDDLEDGMLVEVTKEEAMKIKKQMGANND